MKAIMLLVFTLLPGVGSAIYLLRARGYFDPKQQPGAGGRQRPRAWPGMDLTFSGFPIGTGQKVELGEQGNVRICIDVRERTPSGCAPPACSRW
jgi:phospholipid/cholesterol/gamma-HCH transport system substrate-binding protein